MDNVNTVFNALAIIESRISEKLTVEIIAGSVYMSKYYFGRLSAKSLAAALWNM